MNTIGLLWLAWPWIGFGGGIVILILLCTNILRSNLMHSRWKDPVWLSWAMVLAYLIHVCEEYGMHITDSQFVLVTTFIESGISDRFGGIPLIFFPYVNILYTWVALPAAAIMSKKKPIIGLAGIGFILINGLTHLGACISQRESPLNAPGSVTGIFVFLPLFVWTVYICKRESLLPRRGLGIAVVSGVIAHILLFSVYLLNMLAGHAAVYFYVPVVCFSPLWIAWLLCRIMKVEDGCIVLPE